MSHGRASLGGSDLARVRQIGRRRGRAFPALLVGALIAALFLAALRVDLIRMRYGLGAAMSEEKRLLEEQRELTAELRRLRDPLRLARLSRRLGLARPERVIELPPVSAATAGRP